MNYPTSLKQLIESFKALPGIGEKTAERLAFSVLEFDQETAITFSDSIKDVKTKIKRCEVCNNISEENLCQICKNKDRNQTVICVVEDPRNTILFERIGTYTGL